MEMYTMYINQWGSKSDNGENKSKLLVFINIVNKISKQNQLKLVQETREEAIIQATKEPKIYCNETWINI